MNKQKEIVLSKIKDQIRAIDPGADIILYGSRARGTEHADSDWDLLILTDKKADIETEKVFRHKLYDLELELEQAFSIFVYNKQDWRSKHWMTPFYKNITAEGVIL